MNNTNIPTNFQLPTTRSLKSTIVAACTAAILLITVILPAEYGIDYTGVGSILGLTRMGEIKVNLAAEASNENPAIMADIAPTLLGTPSHVVEQPSINRSAATSESPSARHNIKSDEITITLRPDEGKEIKLAMNKGDNVEYLWRSDGGKVNFDSHADSKPLNIKCHGYGKGSEQRSEGVLSAAFDGNHGWFWRNRNSKTVTVTLQIKGTYVQVLEM
jgi:hypothetical protein